jgi:hypothetical protein
VDGPRRPPYRLGDRHEIAPNERRGSLGFPETSVGTAGRDLALNERLPRCRRRTFSLHEANGAIPLVARITRDIVDGHRKISELDCEAHALTAAGKGEAAERLRQEIRDLFENIDAYVGELGRIGCEYKDRAKGLVDFPARLGGRPVYLCWKYGEPEILYWHEAHAGFAGRRPVRGYFPSDGEA